MRDMKPKKIGKITITEKRLIQPEELEVAVVLAKTGKNVSFLEESSSKMPDIIYTGIRWENKTPRGSSKRTLENNLRLAVKQSSNIIIYLRYMKRPELNLIRELERQARMTHGIKRLKAITKRGYIIDIK